MNMKQPFDIPDAQARQGALNPEASFIVQAPAGSGKTGLLVQRFLALLSRVRSSEEIIAITFTRKAAAEMKERVLSALKRAGSDAPPETPHEAVTWALARKARAHDAASGWDLMNNPSRLRISTIDALCASLVRRMPVLAGLGMQPQIIENADPLYREAAANTVMELESAADWSDSVEALIRHVDNHIGRVEALIAAMLTRRDQWLRHVVDAADIRLQRESLEAALCGEIESALCKARAHMPAAVVRGLPGLARFAANNLFSGAPGSDICQCLEMHEIPECIPNELGTWQGIAELLLTKTGGFRKSVDKRIGFPAKADGDAADNAAFARQKNEFKALLEDISGCEAFAEALHGVRLIPAPYYTEEQWRLVEALFEILKLSVAHLHLVFQKQGAVDFTEMSLRAASALGGSEDPTDLALLLDYGISHILVDEFQDTSISQFELFLKLTAGWMPGDGRTFFAVGDPMQSIYRFREAEVGLFLKAWESGLGPHLPLERLRLVTNFRSDAGIVTWINDTFVHVFPEKSDISTGAVAYSPSAAVHPEGDGPAVRVHPLAEKSHDREAEIVADCIRRARHTHPAGSVAVLVRSRSHLTKILPGLRQSEIPYRAVEIEALGKRPVISDLTALTRALSHPADRVAWLAVLRAPWCGLRLEDLHALAGDESERPLYERMQEPARRAHLSGDGRARLDRVLPVLNKAMAMRGRWPLRRLVEHTWTALGGPACVKMADISDAGVYLDFLESSIDTDALIDYPAFEDALMHLFSRPDPEADTTVEVMTIHKAKGLEFDTVIVPGLERVPRGESEKLLLWQELPHEDPSRAGLLLAPIAEAGTEKDPTYTYIKTRDLEKNAQETRRLLYVAATRARKRLEVVGCVNRAANGGPALPNQRSLLHCLWPAVANTFFAALREKAEAGEGGHADHPPVDASADVAAPAPPLIRRLCLPWEAPSLPGDVPMESGQKAVSENGAGSEPLRFDWAGITVRMVGTIVHKWLRIICETGMDSWDEDRLSGLPVKIRADLAGIGMEQSRLADAADMVVSALRATLADETGCWLLHPHHGGRCEYPLAGKIDDRVVYSVIDRTFIDAQGVRWIIDYKSGVHRGGGTDQFMAHELVRYENQTGIYAALMKKKEPGRKIRRALYFPMFSGWCPWPEE